MWLWTSWESGPLRFLLNFHIFQKNHFNTSKCRFFLKVKSADLKLGLPCTSTILILNLIDHKSVNQPSVSRLKKRLLLDEMYWFCVDFIVNLNFFWQFLLKFDKNLILFYQFRPYVGTKCMNVPIWIELWTMNKLWESYYETQIFSFDSKLKKTVWWESWARASWFGECSQGANLNRMRDFDPRFPSQR